MSTHSPVTGAAEVVCLGILVADVIGRPIDAAPARGALQLVSSITPHIGGCAANTGIGLQMLGVPTAVVGKVGRDGFGDFVRSDLENRGVSAQVIEDETAPTSATMVLVSSDAERSFLHCTGANATFSFDDFDETLLDGARLLHIAGHGLMPRFDGDDCARLLQMAREKGVLTCLDTAGAPDNEWRENLRLCLPHLDYFVPSLHEVAGMFPDVRSPQDIARRLREAGVGVVALKMGEVGSYVTDGHENHIVPPFSVAAVDATGAGDAFAAGFLAGVLRGLDLRGCAQLGNAAGALCVTEVGTVAGYQSFDDTLQFIQEHS
ncbi:MAG TPA: carbohydrate kinase family protein [Abditibacteriaceae bacterium]